MFSIKKSLLTSILCIILATCLICAGAGVIANPTLFVNANMPTIVIDAGHGGIDAGVLGIETGEKESNINLAIARYLRGYFTDAGFNCAMTRINQGGLYESTQKGFKMRDMIKRKNVIEERNADMVISIHQNFCPIPSRRGGQVFYNKDSEQGKNLAECIQNSINGMENCVKSNSALTGDYYMLKCTKAPSVIVECGFLSNKEDEKLLTDSEYQKAIAYAIFKGAVGYYG